MSKYGKVYFKDIYCGNIKFIDGKYEFTYTKEYVNDSNSQAISLLLPLTLTPYQSDILLPFFDGLLPEGYLLYEITDKYKIKPTDRFELLLISGKNSIGAVSVEVAYE